MSTEQKFERVDGKVDNGNLPLRIVKAKEMEEGDVITGTFKRSLVSEKFGSLSYILTDGKEDILINGNGSLNKQMSNVSPGELIQVEYRGAKPIADGKFKGTMSHLFTVRRAINSDEAAS